jgi:NMD protein affecting ribosome stability and mRNA decay
MTKPIVCVACGKAMRSGDEYPPIWSVCAECFKEREGENK